MNNEPLFDISQNLVKFCFIFSLITSSIVGILLIFSFTLSIKKFTSKKSSFLLFQLSISCTFNCISYFFPYHQPPLKETGITNKDIHILCKLQALFHVISLLFSVNLLFIYYLLNYIVLTKYNLATSKTFRHKIYISNLVIIFIFIIINVINLPCPTRLEVCRYYSDEIVFKIDEIYSLAIMVMITFLFILIEFKVEEQMKIVNDNMLIENLKNARRFFWLIAIMVVIKTVSFFVKEEKKINWIFAIDRVCENLSVMSILIFVAIGKQGFVECYKLFTCSSKNNQIDEKSVSTLVEEEKEETQRVEQISEDSSSNF